MKAPKSDIQKILEAVERIETRLRRVEIRTAALAATVAIMVRFLFS